MAYELKGRVKQIGDTQTFGSGFQKREFVVTVEDSKYPQDISLECVGDRVDILEPIRAGDEVTAGFDIRGREYNSKFYNSLVCWKITCDSKRADPPAPATPPSGYDEFTDDGELIPF